MQPAVPDERSASVWALPALFVAAVAGFTALSLDVTRHGALAHLDVRVARWVAGEMPVWVERLANGVTQLGAIAVLSALTVAGALWLLRDGRRPDAALLVAGLVTVSLVTRALKAAFGRPRPEEGGFIPVPHTASFPSGHTSGAVVVLVLVAILTARQRSRWIVTGAAFLAALVGMSRVVLDVHWLTDVLAGYCLGVAIVAAALVVRKTWPGDAAGAPGRPRDEHERHGGQKQERDLGGPPAAEDGTGEPAPAASDTRLEASQLASVRGRGATTTARPAARGARGPARLGP